MPKRKGKQPTRSRPHLAKQTQLDEEDQEELICDAFNLFSRPDIDGYEHEEHGVLKLSDVRLALKALEIPAGDYDELDELEGPQADGYVVFSKFRKYARQRLLKDYTREVDDEEHMKEVQHAFSLFGDGPITLAHLRRVARVLKENVTDDQLVNMILVANGRQGQQGWEAGVTMTEFERVLADAGMWKR